MLRLVLTILLFVLGLFAIFPTPSHYTWYITIMVTEFPWVFVLITLALLAWVLGTTQYRTTGIGLGVAALIMFLYPIVGAYKVGSDLKQRFEAAFGPGSADMQGLHQETPYEALRMITGIGDTKVAYTTYHYANHTGVDLTLDLYPAQQAGLRPCMIMVHGGSWKSGNSHELPDIDWYLARQGYNVAAINYRLAPTYKSPSPIEDVRAAIDYLKSHSAELHIDTTRFVLMGRSAGGHIVLQSAYTLHEPGIKGVVGVYGPTDMIWAYHHPDNPLVMHSQKVMEDYLGGSDTQLPQEYYNASAINFVTPQTVPTLLIHGGHDAHVNFHLSQMLDDKLQQNNVPHLLLGLPWATHGCEYSLNGPSGQLVKYAVERFVKRVTR